MPWNIKSAATQLDEQRPVALVWARDRAALVPDKAGANLSRSDVELRRQPFEFRNCGPSLWSWACSGFEAFSISRI
jgi:hypothetical protein